jgi:hypothetical protein
MNRNIVVRISHFNPDVPKVQIYGDPDGLKWLASELVRLAEYDQSTGFPPDEGTVHHMLPAPRKSGYDNLLDVSVQLDIGRLDRRDDGSFEWFLD